MSYNITVTKLPNSEVELKGEITAEAFEKFRTHAMKHVSEHVEVPGFRKGKVPADVLEKHVSPMAVLQEMADHAFNEFYPKMLDEHKIDAIGNPAIQVTKIAAGNPLGFTIRTATMPEVTLPDYKAIAKKEGKKVETEVTDEELEKAITELKKMRAQQEKPQSETATEEVKEGEEKKEEVLPELTDEYVKALGPFENVADFKTKFRENLKNEKEHREHEKNRLAIIEKILGETKVEVPSLLIESELNRMLYQMQSDISRMGLSYEDYLKHLNKSEEAIREEFKPDAEKRVKMELAMREIAKKEKIEPKEEDIAPQVEALMKQYPGADLDRARVYITEMLTNDKVFAFLEQQAL
jgi:FKBP-type peptidyl-prolyl cis-trans isomerase (trigger factor)